MEKCSKKSKQLCLLVQTKCYDAYHGFLCMASSRIGGCGTSHNYDRNVESVMQNGKTVTVRFQIQWVS